MEMREYTVQNIQSKNRYNSRKFYIIKVEVKYT